MTTGGSKILVTGKGGSGKSTIVTFLAKAMVRLGFRVLVVDSDESNVTLPRFLGLSPPAKTLVEFLGGRSSVAEALFRSNREMDWSFLEGGIDGLPDECVTRMGGLHMVAVGKIGGFGEGCACPLNALAREFLKRIRLREGDVVLVDTEAGIEHFGRGVEGACDIILMVVDPTFESLLLTEKVREMAAKAGKDLFFVLNKVSGESQELLMNSLESDCVLAALSYDEKIVKRCLKGEPLEEVPPEVEGIARKLAGLNPSVDGQEDRSDCSFRAS